MATKFDITDFKRGLLVGNMEAISAHVDSFVNSDAGVRTFDVVLNATQGTDKNAKLAKATLKKILANRGWNPNYQGPDMWHPEERAILYKREDVAIAVIQHPNFDKARLPQVVASAKLLKAQKVLAFLEKQHVRG